MSRRCSVPAFALMAMIAAGCDRAATSASEVTTTSPAGTSSAPSSATAERRHEALVRVVHAIPAGAPLDLFAGDLAVFDTLQYKSVTPYRVLESNRYAFALRPGGMATVTPLATNSEALDDGKYYTVFALPGDGHASLRIVDDELDLPPSGKARLRLVHAGSDAGEVDVMAAGKADAIFDAIDFQTVTRYKDVDPMNTALEVRAQGRAAPIARVDNALMEAGKLYTLVIVGSVRSTPKLEAFVIQDEQKPRAAAP